MFENLSARKALEPEGLNASLDTNTAGSNNSLDSTQQPSKLASGAAEEKKKTLSRTFSRVKKFFSPAKKPTDAASDSEGSDEVFIDDQQKDICVPECSCNFLLDAPTVFDAATPKERLELEKRGKHQQERRCRFARQKSSFEPFSAPLRCYDSLPQQNVDQAQVRKSVVAQNFAVHFVGNQAPRLRPLQQQSCDWELRGAADDPLNIEPQQSLEQQASGVAVEEWEQEWDEINRRYRQLCRNADELAAARGRILNKSVQIPVPLQNADQSGDKFDARCTSTPETLKPSTEIGFSAAFEVGEFAEKQTRQETAKTFEVRAHVQHKEARGTFLCSSTDSEAEDISPPSTRCNNMDLLTTEKLAKSLRENVATIIRPQGNRSAFLRFIAEADGVYNQFKTGFTNDPSLEQQFVRLLLAKFEGSAADTVAMSMPSSYSDFKYAMIKAGNWVRHLSVIENEGRTTKQNTCERPIGYIGRLEVLRNEYAVAIIMDASLTPVVRRFMGASFEKAMVDHAIRSFDDRFLRHVLSRDKSITNLNVLRSKVQDEIDKNVDDTQDLYSDSTRDHKAFRIEAGAASEPEKDQTVTITALKEFMALMTKTAAAENTSGTGNKDPRVLMASAPILQAHFENGGFGQQIAQQDNAFHGGTEFRRWGSQRCYPQQLDYQGWNHDWPQNNFQRGQFQSWRDNRNGNGNCYDGGFSEPNWQPQNGANVASYDAHLPSQNQLQNDVSMPFAAAFYTNAQHAGEAEALQEQAASAVSKN